MDVKPRRRRDVNSQLLPDGSMILFDAAAARAYPISESAAIVWHACDGMHTTGAIVDELADIYDAPADQIARDVEAVLAHLRYIGLLEAAPDEPS